MMHEILALPHEGTSLSVAEIERALRLEPAVYHDGDVRWTYANAQTSVELTLVLARDPTPRLECRIPCPRPGFFATEAAALMRRLAERVPVRLEDVEGFDNCCERAARALRDKGVTVPRWPAEEAERWWSYMRVHDALVQRFDDEGVFAPRIFLFADRRSEPRVRTAVVWCDAQAIAFPPCDLVLVLDRSQEATESGQDTRLRGLVSRERVVEALGARLHEARSEAGELLVLGAKAAPTIRPTFQELPVEPPPSPAELEGITADRPIAPT